MSFRRAAEKSGEVEISKNLIGISRFLKSSLFIFHSSILSLIPSILPAAMRIAASYPV
ncbi:MAG: hypothetical protein WC770_08985 [Phycisphaerae bacterium]